MDRNPHLFEEDLKYARSPTKLFVSNIPFNLNENGLVNIFQNAGFEALSAFIGKPDLSGNRKTTWGFVEVKNISTAQAAINALHKEPPHHLYVDFARSTGPKGSKNDGNDRSDHFDSQSVASSTSMHSRGRGMVPPMEGKPPSRFSAISPHEEPFFGDSSTTNYSNNKFMLPKDLYGVEASNAVNSAGETYSLDGRRKVVMGRGTYVPPENKISETRDPSSVLSELPDEVIDKFFSMYISRRYVKSSEEPDVVVSPEDNHLLMVFKLGQCKNCSRPSMYVCHVCKAWYCSETCRRYDSKDHRKICTPKKIVGFNLDGTLKVVDNEQFSDAVEKMDNLTLNESRPQDDKSPRHPKRSSSDMNDSVTYRKQQSSRPSQEHPSQSIRSPDQDYHIDNRSDRNSQDTFSNGHDNSFDEDRRGHHKNHRESGGQRGGGQGNRGKGGRHGGSEKFKDVGDRDEGYNRDNANGSNRRGGGAIRGNQRNNNLNNRGGSDRNSDNHSGSDNFNNENRNKYRDDPFESKVQTSIKSNIQNGVYKPGRESSTTTHQSKGSANSQPRPQPPIPYDQFTEVTVAALANESNRFWAYSNSVLGEQAEIMQELGNHSKTAKPFNSKLIPGLKVCAPFCGDWYRAEVKHINGDEVTILFIDFGNETSVKTKDILPLPLSIANKPVLAHQYFLARSSDNPLIADDVTLKLKPIRLVGDAWLAHVEGVKYVEQTEEVTITVVTEKDGEFWVRNVKDDPLLEELNTSLGEHSTIKVNPSLDEIYAYCFNKSWLRAKVVNRSPLTIFFIDKGFSINSNIKKNDLHPIPYQYSTLQPLAYKIKLTEESYNAFSSNLKLWQKIVINTIEKTGDAVTCEVVGITENSLPSRYSSHHGKNSNHMLDKLSDFKPSEIHIERQMNDELLIGTLIPLGQSPAVDQISSMIAKNIQSNENIKFTEGMLLAAKWEGNWHRGRFLLKQGKDPLVALLDRGRVVIPDAVAYLPNIPCSVPESAVKVVLKNPISKKLVAGTILKLNEVNELGDIIQADIDTLGETLLVPWIPSIEDAGLSVIQIPPGRKVIISSFTSPKTIYLQSVHPEDVVSRAELLQDVAAETLLCEPLQRKPYAGELLAVRYTDNVYYRAQIYKKQGERYKVIFVDFGNVDLVKLCDMKPLSSKLKAVPCHAVKVGLKGLTNEPFNNQCIHYLNDLTGIETEFSLDYNTDLDNVTLDLLNGENLNSILIEFMTPSWKKKNFDPAVSDVFTEANLDYEKWKKGEKFQIMVPKVMRHNSIAVLRTDSKLLSHIESTLTPNITKYCESFDSIYSYVPRPNEVCLAFFEEDGNWYRALSRKIYQQNSSDVFYLDYGNCGVVLHKNIRKMISDFMSTPVALKICKIYGIPDKVSSEVKKRLSEYFNDFTGDAVVVRETPEETILWIPALESLASVLGFEIKPPNI